MLYKFNKEKGWCLTDIKKIGAPIFGIMSVDITGDGIKELIVLTIKGVHILQVRFTQAVSERLSHPLTVHS